MPERVVDKATRIIKPVVEDLGYIFVDLEYRKDYSGQVLELIIDKPNGVNINDCEKVSRSLDEPLEVHDVTEGKPYNFNVSSYGLDRAFKTDYDFNKHLEKLVDIKFYAPFNGDKLITGVLKSFEKDSIMVIYNKEEIKIDRKLIATICAHIEF